MLPFCGMEGAYFDFDAYGYLDLLVFLLQISDYCRQASPHEPCTVTSTCETRRQLRVYEPPDGLACVHCKLIGHIKSQ